jgi:hypothetical protein
MRCGFELTPKDDGTVHCTSHCVDSILVVAIVLGCVVVIAGSVIFGCMSLPPCYILLGNYFVDESSSDDVPSAAVDPLIE